MQALSQRCNKLDAKAEEYSTLNNSVLAVFIKNHGQKIAHEKFFCHELRYKPSASKNIFQEMLILAMTAPLFTRCASVQMESRKLLKTQKIREPIAGNSESVQGPEGNCCCHFSLVSNHNHRSIFNGILFETVYKYSKNPIFSEVQWILGIYAGIMSDIIPRGIP